MSDFMAKWQRRHGKLDRQFGERLRFAPMASASGYVAGAADASRSGYDVIGILDQHPDVVRSEGRHAKYGDRADLSVSGVRIDFSEAAFPGGPEVWPKAGDRISTLDRAVTLTFEVVAVLRSGLGRVTFSAVRVA